MKLGITALLTDETLMPDRLAIAVEDRGFTSLFLSEHSNIPADRRTPYPGTPDGVLPRSLYRLLDPFIALTAAAVSTTSITLGTAVILIPQRDVVYLAKEIATLDHLSGGRLEIGVGAGWNIEELEVHGVDSTTRGDRLVEQIRALREIWSHDPAEFHGEHINFAPIHSWPKPVSVDGPPIFLGALSRAALGRVVQLGTGWMPSAEVISADELARKRDWFAAQGVHDIRIKVYGAAGDKAQLEVLGVGGVEEVLLYIGDQPESQMMRTLDRFASLVDEFART
jgi:probable F420-dependent oxidoreductase